MMQLDLLAVAMMTAVVVNVAGVLFLLETIIRHEEHAGRVWALSFLAGMLTTVCYLIWAMEPDLHWSSAVGNGALVASAGFMWLGCRSFNRRRMTASAIVVVAGALVVYQGTVFDAANGDWAGALPMFFLIALFTGFGGLEALRGEMSRHRNAVGLAVALMMVCAYYVTRSVVLLTLGPDSELFQTWFGTMFTSIVTVILTIVALLTTSVLRAERARVRGVTDTMDLRRTVDGVLLTETFITTFDELIERAARKGESAGIVSVRIDDLAQISTAFGTEEAETISRAWREATRDAAPSQSQVGDDGFGGLAVSVLPTSPREARDIAFAVRNAVDVAVRGAGVTVVPKVAVGCALASIDGTTAVELIAAARADASDDVAVPDEI